MVTRSTSNSSGGSTTAVGGSMMPPPPPPRSRRDGHNGNKKKNPVVLSLARGLTARSLPLGNGSKTTVQSSSVSAGVPAASSSGIRGLSLDEVDKDLRHFGAHRAAVIRYRQEYFMAVNELNGPGGSGQYDYYNNNVYSTAGSAAGRQASASSASSSLPVRIDPEEETRQQRLKRKIHLAECQFEKLELEYVALRAHYIMARQEQQQRQEEQQSVLTFLKQSIDKRSAALGMMRARMQMTRDVLDVLQKRRLALSTGQQAPQSALPGDGSTAADNNGTNDGGATAASAGTSSNDQLERVWQRLDDDLKKANGSASAVPKRPMHFPCTKLPSTPFDVPILLSAISAAPEKTIAYGMNQAFGSKPDSLCWTNDVSDSEEVDTDDTDALAKQVEVLQSELSKERRLSQHWCQKIADSRNKDNEWVAMTCLLRQETESILHRHNILLQSAVGEAASQALYDKELLEQQQQQTLQGHGGAMDVLAGASEERVNAREERGSPVERASSRGSDKEANVDGDDDEGSDGRWNGNKRGNAVVGTVSPSKSKRRRL